MDVPYPLYVPYMSLICASEVFLKKDVSVLMKL